MAKEKKDRKKIKRVDKNELKKVKGGVDIVEKFMNVALNEEQGAGSHMAVDVGSGSVGLGFKIKW